MALPLAAAATATTAAAAYLDAKFHILKDISGILMLKNGERAFRTAMQEGKVSLFYPFEKTCQKDPEKLAIWSREGCYTRGEFYRIACQYGNHFWALGIRPGDLVALYHTNTPEYMFMWLGLWSIGASPAMINFNLAEEALVHCVRISGATLLMVDEDEACQQRVNGSKDKLESGLGVKVVVLTSDLKAKIISGDASRPSDPLRNTANTPKAHIALFYTSGTTGLPKAFGFEVVRVYPAVASKRPMYNMEPGKDIWYCCMPLYHGTGGVLAINAAINGTAVAIGKKFSTRNFWSEIRDSGATAFVYVGETARYLLSAPPSIEDKNHNVRLMFGNGMRPDVWAKFQERFGVAEVGEFFNSTEGMLQTVIYSRSGFGRGSVGHHGLIVRALMRSRYVPVAIDPQTGEMWRDPVTGFAQRKKYSEGGEMLVKMASRADWPGYYRSEDATKKKFIYDVFEKGDMYYKPGDALRRDDDGLWYFMDRLGDTFRWKGENVSTAEVSEVLGHFDGVQEANVYGVTLPNHDGRAGCAAIEFTPAAKERFNWSGLAKHSTTKLPKYAVPLFLRVVSGESGSMGSHNNKQNKAQFREEGVDPALRGKKVAGGERDRIFWLPPGTDIYVPFTDGHWNQIKARTLKL